MSLRKDPPQADFFVMENAYLYRVSIIRIEGHDMMVDMLKIPTIFFLISISVLATIHHLALQFSLYWLFWWFDIVVHFMGGAAVALGIFTIFDFFPRLPERLLNLIPVVSGVLIVGLLWELFELQVGVPVEGDFGRDIVIDLIMDCVGGVVGFFVGQSIKKL